MPARVANTQLAPVSKYSKLGSMSKGSSGKDKGKGLSAEQRAYIASLASELIASMGVVDESVWVFPDERLTLSPTGNAPGFG